MRRRCWWRERPRERAGSAAALPETDSELGGALGIAILGSIGAAPFHSALTGNLPEGIPPQLGDVARDGLSGAVATAHRLPDTLGTELLAAELLAAAEVS